MTNKEVKQNHSVTKAYSYSYRDVNLSFSLNIDNKKQLLSFKKCLREALEDVTDDLERVENV